MTYDSGRLYRLVCAAYTAPLYSDLDDLMPRGRVCDNDLVLVIRCFAAPDATSHTTVKVLYKDQVGYIYIWHDIQSLVPVSSS